jgi:hypothetical protein
MKTIEERAIEWVDSQGAGSVHPYNRLAMIDAYIAGAKAQYEELMHWHDPRWELPEPSTPVLGKQQDNQKTYYKIVYRHEYDNEDGRYRWTDSEGCPIYVDGWRKIHA